MTSIRILNRRLPSRLPTLQASTRSHPHTLRAYSTSPPQPPEYLDERERGIFDKLSSIFSPTKLEVQDVSGGCGSMYAVEISSEKFKGLTLLKQHRLVKDALGDDVKQWHGFQLRTKVPE